MPHKKSRDSYLSVLCLLYDALLSKELSRNKDSHSTQWNNKDGKKKGGERRKDVDKSRGHVVSERATPCRVTPEERRGEETGIARNGADEQGGWP
jgi:hypothetical protein